MNDYYVATSNVPPADTRSNPDLYTKAEFALIEDAFDKFPSLSAANSFRELTVGSSGLSLGPGYQEARQTQAILLGETDQDLPGLNGLRIDAGGVYRVHGVIFYTLVPVTTTSQPQINLVFTETPSYSAGIAISGDRANGTGFSLWETEVVFKNDTGTNANLGELHGVIVGGAQNAILSFTAISVGPGGTVAIAQSSNIKLTRFYGD